MWVASARIDDGARPTDSSAAVLHNGVSAGISDDARNYDLQRDGLGCSSEICSLDRALNRLLEF